MNSHNGLERSSADDSAPIPPMQLFAYNKTECTEQEITQIDQVREYLGKWPVIWLNVDGVANKRVVTGLGDIFGLHPLAIEDVIHLNQRPKVEEYARHEFIVARMVTMKEELITEQLSIFLGENFVVTFQEDRPGDCFDDLRDRIRKGRGRLRALGPDYLAYALLDAVVDGYFPVLESHGERLEDLEDEILTQPTRESIVKVHTVKRELHTLRRAVWPLRDALSYLYRDPVALISPDTRIYLRDCYDHCVRIMDLLETDRELCSDLMDVYLSSTSNRVNQVIKVLTIVTTILMPPGLIASIYGMNFNPERSPFNMPELNWYFGYFFSLLLMLACILIGCVLWYFWEKGYLQDLRAARAKSSGGRH